MLISSLFIILTLQAQVSKTVNITAGGLSAALTSEEKNTITNLTITGILDARDFKTMRDNMPLLSEIDLSATMVIEYTGTEGTAGISTKTYSANEIPQSAFSIDQESFKLTSIQLPSSITSIGSWAFEKCLALTTIKIPSTVKSIGDITFSSCSLNAINIPVSVETIGQYAFASCYYLTDITVNNSIPSNIILNTGVFYGVNTSKCILHVPIGSETLYQGANQWKDFTNIIETTTAVSTVIDERMNLYPNPASVGFYINTGEKINTVSIYNLNGEIILSNQAIKDNFIDIKSLESGIYFVKVQTENGVIINKLLKK